MDMPIDATSVAYIENLLAAGELDRAQPLVEDLVEQVELYADEECPTSETRQWFSFANAFERLAYRRVERDPRELVQVDAPFDRLYAAEAYLRIQRQEFDRAREALMQAVRWNPMDCAYRLDLADLYGMQGDERQQAALSASVIDRASDARLLGRAYANLCRFFLQVGDETAAEACRRSAQRFAPDDPRTKTLTEHMGRIDPELARKPDDEVRQALEEQGVSPEPPAEMAVCLLMCASDAAAAGDKDQATRYTIAARDLVGSEACSVLIKLIRESDDELARERAAQGKGE